MPDLQAGIATFLFTDVEGSTRLWEADPRAMAEALARHDAILRDAISAAGGEIFKTAGDAFCAVFASPIQAISAAIAAQRALAATGHSPTLRVRMAIHSGHAEARDGDYFGPPLNRVARLLAIAHGGQVLVSRAAAELARDTLEPVVTLRDLGDYSLRDLHFPERIFQLLAPDLASDFPPLRTPEQLVRNVPRPATPLIGREREIEFARSTLMGGQTEDGTPENPLLTLTGPGGAGKTRLALHLAAELGVEFADGALFVPLAEISEPSLVPAAIAAAMDLNDSSDEAPSDQLLDRLRDRQLLLILDNLEQVIGAAPLVADLLAYCPRLRIVATSRERLKIRGEQELPLPALAVPSPHEIARITADDPSDALEAIGRSEAVRLFVTRSQAVKPGFALTAENAKPVSELCQRLDGLPLAIELAAARVRLLSPQAILDRFARSIDALDRGPRDLPARQQTMRAAIAWSYDLLDPAERRLFAGLAIFAGGADLSALESVVGEAVDADADVFALIESLADKSLLRLDDGPDEPRVAMLQTIREYGEERLAGSPDAVLLAGRHAAHFLSLAEATEPLLSSSGQSRALDLLETEQANLRSAVAWLRARGRIEDALRLAASLWRFWWLRGDVGEGRRVLGQLLAESATVGPEVLAKALNGAGVLADSQGDWDTAASLHERSLDISRARADLPGVAWSLNNLGVVAINRGDLARAKALLEENLTVAEQTADDAAIATSLMDLGQVAFHEGELERADALWRRSLALFDGLQDETHTARSLNNLGYVAVQQGRLDEAHALFADSLTHHRNVGDRQGIASTLNNLAAIAHATGHPEAAEQLYLEGYALALEGGSQLYAAIALENLAALNQDRGAAALAEARFREALRLYRAVGDLHGIGTCLGILAAIAATAGRAEVAATLLGAVSRYQEHHPDISLPNLEANAGNLRQALGEPAFRASWEKGRELSIDDVVHLATTERVSAKHLVG